MQNSEKRKKKEYTANDYRGVGALCLLFFGSIACYLSQYLMQDGHIDLPGLILVLGFAGFALLGLVCLLFPNALMKHDRQETKDRENDVFRQVRKDFVTNQVIVAFFLLLIGSFMVYGAVTFIKEVAGISAEPETESLAVVVKDCVRHEPGAKSSHYYWTLTTEQLPKVRFDAEFPIHALPGDTVLLRVDADDFHAYVAKDREMTFIEKHVNINIVKVFSMTRNNWGKGYSETYHDEEESPVWVGIFVFMFMVIIGFIIFYDVKSVREYRQRCREELTKKQ